MYDDDTGYELNDPKHPSFFDRMADYADLARKRERENPVLPPPVLQESDE